MYLNEFTAEIIRLGLKRIRKLLALLGNPEECLKIIHVAGTNGKGSTCAYISEILKEAGFKIGIYTSPYICEVNENIAISYENGRKNISNSDLDSALEEIKRVLKNHKNLESSLTRFEVLTATALVYFKREGCDFAVLETGMGGEYDSTNAVKKPMLSVITNIGFDHMEHLGKTIKRIASAKAGIIKKRVPVVLAKQDFCEAVKVINTYAKRKKTYVCEADSAYVLGYEIGMKGAHQTINASTAFTAIKCLRELGIIVSNEAVAKGLREAKMPARLQLVNEKPRVFLDGAHNLAGVTALKEFLISLPNFTKAVLVFGILKDKDYTNMAKVIAPIAGKVFTVTPNSPRALSAYDLANALTEIGINALPCDTTKEALISAENEAGGSGTVAVFGSFYFLSEAMEYYKG
ncbi:MAG: bifunctional folylpolyglutamate synthase/dihydrofolate synthase [Firmicutes bacterium]|nr:bifunctional folylpolyglutamate synthase/dihydrofolate synthase [Bacillota bacterium]